MMLNIDPRKYFLPQTATVFASSKGLKVTVEDSKCVQANAFIQESIFHQFIIKEDQMAFKINLTVLLVYVYININKQDLLFNALNLLQLK